MENKNGMNQHETIFGLIGNLRMQALTTQGQYDAARIVDGIEREVKKMYESIGYFDAHVNNHESDELTVLMFSGKVRDVTPHNSLCISRSTAGQEATEILKKSILIDGDDLVFLSSTGDTEILRMDLQRILENGYTQAKDRALGMRIEHRLEMAACMREKAKSLGINFISENDWNDIFYVMARTYHQKKAAPYEIGDC
ncbi:hypothetical protein A4K52_002101 [Salmonella enterica subsp. arizonae]|nr:hypothetical protein [Salmonella enterica subsp. arizonae]